MRWWRKKKTQKFITGLFFSALLFQGLFQFAGDALADNPSMGPYDAPVAAQQTQATQATNKPAEASSSGLFGWMLDAIVSAFIWLLLQIRNIIYYLIVSPAAGAFVWVVDPTNISGPQGVLNLPAVYTLWQFIRDFFNLFFILILLFSAFATIFQVDSFNIRNIFKNILLVALLINFSFPITRFLIDAANVPMYYFINDVLGASTGNGGQTAMNNLLGDSGISAGALASIGDDDSITLVVTSIVFAFLFGISLAVLSIMMIVRLIALTLLLIFSPIGYAGSLLPGMNRYGQEWWSKFWSYALFGPAAALMLVVALKFLEAVSSGGVWQSMNAVTTNMTPDPVGAVGMAQVILFAFPIILIWTTIGMANKFSIAGAATITGMGYGAAHWTRKKMQKGVMYVGRNNPITNAAVGAGKGVAQRFNNLKPVKWFKAPSGVEARVRGAVGTSTARAELDKLHESQVKKELDEMKKNKTSHSEAVEGMKTGSKASQQASALYLAQNDDIRNAAEFRDGLAAMAGNAEFTSEFVKKSQGAIDNVTDLATALNSLGADSKTAAAVIDKINPSALPANAAEYASIISAPALASPASRGQFQGKMKREGRISPVIDHEIMTTGVSGAAATAVVDRHLDGMTVEEIAKQDSLLRTNPDAHGYVLSLRTTDPAKYQEIKNKMKSGTSALFP
ncbi:MAG: hypothetical protein WAT81_01920 [Candidatus Moraniibacteriota bacterium]